MELLIKARMLADFIAGHNSLQDFYTVQNSNYSHIGALYTNIVLQAGLNYEHVVRPRVERVKKYSEAQTVNGFVELIKKEGIESIILWRRGAKIDRLQHLLEYSTKNNINTCDDLKVFFRMETNRMEFLSLKGFGPKTLDYMLKLLDFDTIAVDRHIYAFVRSAGIPISDYYYTKSIVEYAADLLNVSRSNMDYSIWKFMSERTRAEGQNNLQLSLLDTI